MQKVFLDVYDASGICANQCISPYVFPPFPTTTLCYTTKHCTAKGKYFGRASMLREGLLYEIFILVLEYQIKRKTFSLSFPFAFRK